MSYWDLSSDGKPAEEVVAEGGGGDLVYPDGSWVTVSLDEAKWNQFKDGERHVSLRATILAPAEFDGVKIANRKLFTKLWLVDGNRAEKGDKAEARKKRDWTMITAIDSHCGGGLLKAAKKAGKDDWVPTDEDFASNLLNKPFAWRIGMMISKQDGKNINFMNGVAAPSRQVEIPGSLKTQVRQQNTGGGSSDRSRVDYDDEIPF